MSRLGSDDILALQGEVQDDQQTRAAKICFAQTYGQSCTDIKVYPGDAITGTWSYALQAVEGLDNQAQSFALYGVDGADNDSAPVSRTYQVDTVPPVVTITLQVNELPTAVPTPVLGGTVSDSSGIAEMYVNVETPGGSTFWDPVALVGGVWLYTLYPQETGRYTLRVKVWDSKGNVSEYGPFEVIVGVVPIAGLSATNDSPTPLGQATTLTATIASGTSITYAWAFGDGDFGIGVVVNHVYPAVNVYTPVVTASNSAGLLTATTMVSIVQPDYRIYLPFVLKNR